MTKNLSSTSKTLLVAMELDLDSFLNSPLTSDNDNDNDDDKDMGEVKWLEENRNGWGCDDKNLDLVYQKPEN